MSDALRAAEVGLANLLSYQSAGKTPTIHEYGQARRALDAIRAELAKPAQATQSEVLGGVYNLAAHGLMYLMETQYGHAKTAFQEIAAKCETALAQIAHPAKGVTP